MPNAYKKNFIKWLLSFIAIFFILIILPVISFFIFEYKYQNKFYHGIYLGDINLSGKNYQKAKTEINSKINYFQQNGIIFHYYNQDTILYPIISSMEGDLAFELISFDVDNTLNDIYQIGRTGNFYQKFLQKISTFFNKRKYSIGYTINSEEVKKFLQDNFSQFNTPAKNAELTHEQAYPNSQIKFNVAPEIYGQALDFERAIKEFKNNVKQLNFNQINISANIDYPEIFAKDVLNVEANAQKILNYAPLTLIYEKSKWNIDKQILLDWLILKTNTNTNSNDNVIVGIDCKLAADYLQTNIAPEINQEPVDAKFEIIDGKVNEFQASADGLLLDESATCKKIENELFNNNREIKLIVNLQKSKMQTEDINDMGIREIIGVGHSNFAGSPNNRRHNIKIGADSVNGTIVAPDEEFSLIETLGEIDETTGYLPELVIKENKTIPEYGGGLCQIGTTMFRATIDSGMPVAMRRNHSYRVSYYEPAGTDATIYNPWPDYKFKNDSKYHILIQSRIEGDDLYFEFWSTEDGRVATNTYPYIYNIVRPGPTKIIETLDLEPGVKKCTERAHNGADAYFDYKVTYPNNEVKEERFHSHYVPWREVCLLGVEKLPESDEGEVKGAEDEAEDKNQKNINDSSDSRTWSINKN